MTLEYSITCPEGVSVTPLGGVVENEIIAVEILGRLKNKSISKDLADDYIHELNHQLPEKPIAIWELTKV